MTCKYELWYEPGNWSYEFFLGSNGLIKTFGLTFVLRFREISLSLPSTYPTFNSSLRARRHPSFICKFRKLKINSGRETFWFTCHGINKFSLNLSRLVSRFLLRPYFHFCRHLCHKSKPDLQYNALRLAIKSKSNLCDEFAWHTHGAVSNDGWKMVEAAVTWKESSMKFDKIIERCMLRWIIFSKLEDSSFAFPNSGGNVLFKGV